VRCINNLAPTQTMKHTKGYLLHAYRYATIGLVAKNRLVHIPVSSKQQSAPKTTDLSYSFYICVIFWAKCLLPYAGKLLTPIKTQSAIQHNSSSLQSIRDFISALRSMQGRLIDNTECKGVIIHCFWNKPFVRIQLI